MRICDLSLKLLIPVSLVVASCQVPMSPAAGWREPGNEPFVTGPYILLGQAGTAFVVIKEDLTEPPVVEWWVSQEGAEIRRVESERDGSIWVATLTELPLGPTIHYRVRSNAGNTRPHRFRAGVEAGDAFRFAAFGDTRTRHDVHRAVIERVARENIDFLLHTGDMVERGGLEELWDIFFQVERPLLVNAPVLPAIGNHDVGNRDYFRHYFLHKRWAKDLRYFAYDWGNLRVVSIDGGIECRSGCTQYGFAERALAEGARKGMFMVIMLHYPPYSSGKHGSHKGVQKPITDLARRHGVELVISGHDHNYERTKPIHGTTYVVSGSAGAPIHPVYPSAFTAEARTEPHYVLVDVEGEQMVLRAVNLDGETFDTYVIRHNLPKSDAGFAASE